MSATCRSTMSSFSEGLEDEVDFKYDDYDEQETRGDEDGYNPNLTP